MPGAKTEAEFNCSAEQFFDLVTDYTKYSQFLNEVKKCQVIEEKKDHKIVEYTVSVIKEFKYRLRMFEQKPTAKTAGQVHWTFDSGDIFKTQTGSWSIAAIDKKKCKVVYEVDATFNLFVPGPIAKALVSVNLPGMIAAYQKRIAQIYG